MVLVENCLIEHVEPHRASEPAAGTTQTTGHENIGTVPGGSHHGPKRNKDTM